MSELNAYATIEFDGPVQADDRVDAFHTLLKMFPGSSMTVHDIGGDHVLGVCEMCDDPIFEDEPFWQDNDSVMWHKKCGDGRGNDVNED